MLKTALKNTSIEKGGADAVLDDPESIGRHPQADQAAAGFH